MNRKFLLSCPILQHQFMAVASREALRSQQTSAFVFGQRIGRAMQLVIEAAGNERLVRVAFDKFHKDLLTHPG